MRPSPTLLAALLPCALLACSGDDGGDDGTVIDDTDAVVIDDGDERVPDTAPNETIQGNLSEGATMELSWASSSSMACWPGNEDPNFTGNHVLYERTQPVSTTFIIRVTPADGVDVSVYGIQRTSGTTTLPPDLTSAFSCEAGYDAPNDSNPGEAEVIELTGYAEYATVIGVAGANGAASGAYVIEIWEEDSGLSP